jgi:hypothetical protein
MGVAERPKKRPSKTLGVPPSRKTLVPTLRVGTGPVRRSASLLFGARTPARSNGMQRDHSFE